MTTSRRPQGLSLQIRRIEPMVLHQNTSTVRKMSLAVRLGRLVLAVASLTPFAPFPANAAEAPKAAENPSKRPNVLFLALDDLNDWTGFLGGHPGTLTPNMDRLAQRGVVFSRAYCSAPLCNPSRASLLTGVRPATSGVYQNDQPWRPVLKDAVTLPQYFAAAGYHVVGGGKIFHNSYNDPQSWQEWFKPKKGDPHPAKVPVNGIPNTAHFDWGPLDVPDDAMGDNQVVSWAIETLKKQPNNQPLFLAVGLIRPHLPWYVPRKYFDLHPLSEIQLPEVKADDLDDIPPAGLAMAKREGDHRKVLEHKQWQKAVQGYLASISFADAQVGRLLDALDATPQGKETIIVLWGDHGWHLGQKEHWRKFALWEEATRTSLIVVAPGLTPPGTRSERTVSLMDLYPTLIELCGLPPKSGIEANSLVPLLQDPKAAWNHPALTTFGRGNHAMRTERWRYIRYADGTEELYDHTSDPKEWNNLAADPRWKDVKTELARSLPSRNAAEAPREKGSPAAKPKAQATTASNSGGL